jgi:hypothetical protein
VRDAAGRGILVVSGLGFPLTQLVIGRLGRRGAAVVLAVTSALLVRDATLVALGTPRQLRRLPALLLLLETGAAAAATILGPVALARPGHRVDRSPGGVLEGSRRLAVGLLVGVHTYRFWIYLRPHRGLRGAAGAPLTRETP